MPPKERGRIDSNVEMASQHPDRSTVTTSVAKQTSPQPTATTAGEEAEKVEDYSAQPSDKTKSSQSASQQQQVVSAQLKKFLVTCLVVAGIGWLLAVVGICTDHWLSHSLQKVGHIVKPVTEGMNTVTEAVTPGGVATTAADTVKSSEATPTPTITDVERNVTRKPSRGNNWVDDAVDDAADWVENAAEDAGNAAQDLGNAMDDVFSGNKSLEEAFVDFFSVCCRSLGTDRVHIGLFHCGMDCDGWMVGVQALILTGFLLATAGMVLMTLHLVLKGRKPWMPTVGGVSCLIGGIFTVNGVIASFLTTPYFDEPEWSFLVTFIGGLLFMVAGVLVLLLQRYDRIQSRSEG